MYISSLNRISLLLIFLNLIIDLFNTLYVCLSLRYLCYITSFNSLFEMSRVVIIILVL